MREELKAYLAENNISEEEYNGGSLEAKAKLVEAFEKSIYSLCLQFGAVDL